MAYSVRVKSGAFDTIKYNVDSFCHRLKHQRKEIPVTISKGIILRGKEALEARDERELQKIRDRNAFYKAKINKIERDTCCFIVPLILISLAIIALFILHETGTIDFFGHW